MIVKNRHTNLQYGNFGIWVLLNEMEKSGSKSQNPKYVSVFNLDKHDAFKKVIFKSTQLKYLYLRSIMKRTPK